jgi:outer membrane receptor protein involved in Fe transport
VQNDTGAPLPQFAGQDIESPASLFTYDTFALYGEVVVPVVSRRMRMPAVDKLEVFASARGSMQRRHGFRNDGAPVLYETEPYLWAAGFRYDAVPGVALRVSRSVGFKPPTFAQVTPALPPTNVSNLTDPSRNSEPLQLSPSQYISGGNSDLDPETTVSDNFGIILQPRWNKGLRLTLDYLESIRDDAITSIGLQEVLNLEMDFPDRVQRAAPLSGAPNGVGVVTYVDARNINFRQITARSADLTVEQIVPDMLGGRLIITAAVTKQISVKVQTTNSAPPVEQVRNPAAPDITRQLKWNGNAQVRWEKDQWVVGWSGRYYDYLLVNPTPTILLRQNSDRAGAEIDHDVFFAYRFPDAAPGSRRNSRLLAGTSITCGVKNVFDREPRFWASDLTRGVAPYDSIIGRTVWMQVRRNF